MSTLLEKPISVNRILATSINHAKAIEDPARAKIVQMLYNRNLNAEQITLQLKKQGHKKALTTIRHHLDILKESIAVEITASKSPIIEVKAAINTRKKNNPPRNIPKGISLKSEAIVTNNNPGPELGSIPNANNAGNMTSPAKIAIAVSKKTTIPTLPGISLLSLSK